jgi:hypothetical protein
MDTLLCGVVLSMGRCADAGHCCLEVRGAWLCAILEGYMTARYAWHPGGWSVLERCVLSCR